ncbi:DUF1376 domain-containing protein [Bartonella vinsonii]|uniref:Uncharacterized protein conserved in bacteria n=1 Tax=Bartonella vinsonii TaxID=33047 RepID=A0A3S5F8T3_BARVI|nr:DUF1376 domain-containing protein [Bartonella vinsonii]VEJ45242.1 Uncharacterized protein conserved in bacteria [Bartonella vinsonii]
MSNRNKFVTINIEKWLLDLADLPPAEGNIYMRLRLKMLHTGKPLPDNLRALAALASCSVNELEDALDLLLETGHIIRQDDGHLWNLDLEKELKDSNEKLNKSSERARKAAEARWHKHKEEVKDVN